MKRTFFSLVLALMAALTLSAQTILMGDTNGDDQLTIADVTSTVNMVLGKSPALTVDLSGMAYRVDNSGVAGRWKAPDNSRFTLNADGTTDYPGAATYEFRPFQGTLLFCDALGNPVRMLHLAVVASDHLLAVDCATQGFTLYTNDPDSHEYVDLGLPSGTLWATCNIGADNPEDYGDYFAWGETSGYKSGKTTFNWSTYKYCNGSYTTMTKYCNKSGYGTVDNKTELELSDDAAYVNWGANWRMPSDDQFTELINSSYTTSTWTTQNGVYGRKITSKSNGNSLFLPAAGYRSGTSLTDAGSYGDYWSRTLDTSFPYLAYCLYSDSSGIRTGDGSRYIGFSVRPVRLSN